jgi:hypothetical protein
LYWYYCQVGVKAPELEKGWTKVPYGFGGIVEGEEEEVGSPGR